MNYLSVLRVGNHGSWSVAILIVGFLRFSFEVLCSVLRGSNVVVVVAVVVVIVVVGA